MQKLIIKKTLLGLFILSILFLSGCDNLQNKDTQMIECNYPYIRHASDCCLDQNENKICDEDELIEEIVEEEKEIICQEECFKDSCEGKYLKECTLRNNGCYRYHTTLEVGKCGVECIYDNDCDSGKECISNICEIKDECSEYGGEITVYVYAPGGYNYLEDYNVGMAVEHHDELNTVTYEPISSGKYFHFCAFGGRKYTIDIIQPGQKSTEVYTSPEISTYVRVTQEFNIYLPYEEE